MAAEREYRINRREFVKSAAALVAGVAVSGGGVADIVMGTIKNAEIEEKARREVQAQGITPPDPEAFQTAQKIRQDIVEHPLAERDPATIRQARETLRQQSSYNERLETRSSQIAAEEGRSTLREGVAVVAIPAGSPLLLRGGLPLLFMGISSRGEAPVPTQNEHPQTSPQK
jgi:hypothetical protein